MHCASSITAGWRPITGSTSMTSGRTPMPAAERVGVLVLALLAAAPCKAAQWGVDALMQQLSEVKQSQARFVERKYLKVLKSPLELSGTLTYVRPGHIEKRT